MLFESLADGIKGVQHNVIDPRSEQFFDLAEIGGTLNDQSQFELCGFD